MRRYPSGSSKGSIWQVKGEEYIHKTLADRRRRNFSESIKEKREERLKKSPSSNLLKKFHWMKWLVADMAGWTVTCRRGKPSLGRDMDFVVRVIYVNG